MMAYQQPAVMAQQQPTMANASPFALAAAPPPPAAPMANGAANPFGTPQMQHPGFGGVAQQQQPPQQQQQPALANFAHPQQPQQPHQQQLVPLAPNAMVASPWALGPPAPAAPTAIVAAPPAAAAGAYDPFNVFGASPAQPPPQNQSHQLVPQPAFQQPQQLQAQPNPYAPQQQAMQTPNAQQNLQKEMQRFNLQKQNESLLPDESEDEGLALIDVELDDDDNEEGENLEDRKKDGEFFGRISPVAQKKSSKSRGGGEGNGGRPGQSWDRNPDIAPPPPTTPGRNHAEYLSQNSAPALSSPLPRLDLVHHSGYVLSRISFRTVLMRKWKQTFWIQYGPTQLLFFRTFSDYEDWINNPYHTMKAREFLVKLRVDFVSDLKKSSVMGYQVTQVRRKPYGKNVMLHFKLERWMDYGPTIAAAFAAREEEMINSPSHRNDGGGMNDTNDVSALRKIILGCMRNARDAALVASRREESDMGEAVGYRGRYDEDHQRETRIPSGTGNMGYHQAFSAESSGRRRVVQDSDQVTDDSEHEVGTPANNIASPVPAPPVVDLLG